MYPLKVNVMKENGANTTPSEDNGNPILTPHASLTTPQPATPPLINKWILPDIDDVMIGPYGPECKEDITFAPSLPCSFLSPPFLQHPLSTRPSIDLSIWFWRFDSIGIAVCFLYCPSIYLMGGLWQAACNGWTAETHPGQVYHTNKQTNKSHLRSV